MSCVFSGTSEVPAFGSMDYWVRLKLPMTETIQLYKDKATAVDHVPSALSQDAQVPALPPRLAAGPARSFYANPLLHCSSCPAAGATNSTSRCSAAGTCSPGTCSSRAPTWSSSSFTSQTTPLPPSTAAATHSSATPSPTASAWTQRWIGT